VRLVDGDRRIGLHTSELLTCFADSDRFMILAARRVKAGSELLLDYGPKYWPRGKKGNPEADDEADDDGDDGDSDVDFPG